MRAAACCADRALIRKQKPGRVVGECACAVGGQSPKLGYFAWLLLSHKAPAPPPAAAHPPVPAQTLPAPAPAASPQRPLPVAHHHSPASPAMAPRSKKDDTGELMVSIEQYTKTRDSVRPFPSVYFCRAVTRLPAIIVSRCCQARTAGAHCRATTAVAFVLARVILIASSTRFWNGTSAVAACSAAAKVKLRVARARDDDNPRCTATAHEHQYHSCYTPRSIHLLISPGHRRSQQPPGRPHPRPKWPQRPFARIHAAHSFDPCW